MNAFASSRSLVYYIGSKALNPLSYKANNK